MLHPDVAPELRGTYAGMASEPILRHLVELGVTAVELMPVHHFEPEGFIVDKDLTNYWGYSTLGFFAPHGHYSASGERGEQVREFKELVKALHSVGIEVLLDVVYNHTTEGTAAGPTLSLRGIDNTTYYHLARDDRSAYADFTGTGNSLNVGHAATLQLVMDSLRYWVQEMHVDGFRFDLAPTLARHFVSAERQSAFLDLIHQDPIVSRVKLIAEPWDVGPGGYQVGKFPSLWSEWNGHFRDDVRDFWKGTDGSLADFASRFAGSADIYAVERRRPRASVNFVTAHDGYTLADLVSYQDKHNEANGESNRDGHSDNRSWNGGVEGATHDVQVLENRRRRSASMMATLLLSQGVPMISGGDEIGRTQHGNNNAYCQDNEISWYDWANVDTEMLALTQRLARFRIEHPVFRRRRFFKGSQDVGSTLTDIEWYRPDGRTMIEADWHTGYARAVTVFLNGNALAAQGPRLDPVVDRSYLIFFNAGADPLGFSVPRALAGERWTVSLDTARETTGRDSTGEQPVNRVDWKVGAWGLVVLERERVPPT